MGCQNSTVVNAPIDKVWSALRDFHDMGWAEGVITSLDKVGDLGGTDVGAKRVLNGAFHETLMSLDDEGCKLTYSIDDGPDAVSKENVQGYVGCVRAYPVTDANRTFVIWTSRWKSGGEGAKAFCDPIYHALLAALGKHFSG